MEESLPRRHGSENANTEPPALPGSAHALPPSIATVSLTMLNPRPVPSTPDTAPSTWARKNRSKSLRRASSGTPSPLSETSTIRSAEPSLLRGCSSRERISTQRSVFAGSEYLIALEM